MNIEELHKLFLANSRICTDSRAIQEGAIFFALKGENFDGNQYAQKALEKGCVYAVVDDPKVLNGENYILVEHVLSSLQELAYYHRMYCNIPVIALTGTNGKTTTKELIAAVLRTKYNLVATEGNLNNQIGVPLTLLRIEAETELAIIEMGANHIGEIESLCKIAAPNYGLITNIGMAHIEGFGSFEGVVQTKTELYQYINQTQGALFVNLDNELLVKEAAKTKSKKYTYSEREGFVTAQKSKGTTFLSVLYEGNTIHTKLVGGYNFENVLAAICIGKKFEIPEKDLCAALELYEPENKRSQLIKGGRNTLVLDAYNANPTSMQAALANFTELEQERKMVILGDMLELGSISKESHLATLNYLEERSLDAFLVGKAFYENKEDFPFEFFQTTTDLIDFLKKEKLESRYILIKGSRGIRLETVLPYLN